jgi:hypothetical protein
MTSDVMVQALHYAERGWFVFPCGWQGERRKHPLTLHGCLDASRDSSIIEAWWQRWPRANVAVATGAVSGDDALDIDPRHGGDVSLAVLVAQYGPLPTTVRAFTGGGGSHILFRHRSGITNAGGKLPVGIDVRGDGGYILATPSVHPNVAPTRGMSMHIRMRPSSRTGRNGLSRQSYPDAAGAHRNCPRIGVDWLPMG